VALIGLLRFLPHARAKSPSAGEVVERDWAPAGRNATAPTLLERADGARRLARQRISSIRRRKFLSQFRLDPDSLPRPLSSPGDNDFVICGCPRSGTTLLCAALFQPPAVITVSEPWEGMIVSPQALFAGIRNELDTGGRLQQGRLDLKALLEEGDVRWRQEDKAGRPVELSGDYLLGVKWPAFWRYLELLPNTKFLVCLRDPIAVVNSFKNGQTRLSLGLEREVAFNARMNQYLRSETSDLALRRVLLYDYVNERLLPHLDRPNVFSVRYERWFTEREALVEELSEFLEVRIASGPAAIHKPTSISLADRELALIRSRCRTAEPLGYSLSHR
jgi:Sulfotransferase family